MKIRKLIFTTVLVMISFFQSCKSTKELDSFFLDYRFGITINECTVVSQALVDKGKIGYGNGLYRTYKFILPDGRNAETRLIPYFYNDLLAGIDLEFGHYSEKSSDRFYDFENSHRIESVVQLYTQKYGNPKMGKKYYFNRQKEYENFETYNWDHDNYEITLFPGAKGVDDGSLGAFMDVLLHYGGKIEYRLKNEEIKKKDLKEAQDHINDI